MGQYAKRLHKKLASYSAGLPTKAPQRRPGDPLPGGAIDMETLIKEAHDAIDIGGAERVVRAMATGR